MHSCPRLPDKDAVHDGEQKEADASQHRGNDVLDELSRSFAQGYPSRFKRSSAESARRRTPPPRQGGRAAAPISAASAVFSLTSAARAISCEKRKCARHVPSALDIFLDLAIAMADPPMTDPAEGLKFGCRRESIRKKKSRTGAGVPACALSSASFHPNDLPSEQAPLLWGCARHLSSTELRRRSASSPVILRTRRAVRRAGGSF